MTPETSSRGLKQALIGRTFMHPVLDYLLIGSVISIFVTIFLAANPGLNEKMNFHAWMMILLVANSTHFTASTVRLYTIPGASRTWPHLTMTFPLVSLAVVSLCILDSERFGPQLQALYLTWTPFHFCRQGYGLAVMYSYRSGCKLSDIDKRWMLHASLLPFYYWMIVAGEAGIDWLLPQVVLESGPIVTLREVTTSVGRPIAFVAPFLVFAKVWRSKSGTMPIIALLCIVTNTMWFTVLEPMGAFGWATVFHGIAYVIIIAIFHVKERAADPGDRHSFGYHAVWFYAMTLLLAYPLFHALPMAYGWLGLGLAEAKLAVIAGISIHHFVVDGYIWHFKKGSGNRRIAEETTLAAI